MRSDDEDDEDDFDDDNEEEEVSCLCLGPDSTDKKQDERLNQLNEEVEEEDGLNGDGAGEYV